MENIVNNMQPSKKRKTEARLTNLLHQIRKKPDNEDKLKEVKKKKVHVKWKRYDFMKGSFQLVPHRKGGGFRYIDVDENVTLEYIKAKALNLFYPNGLNYFDEHESDCKASLTDSAGSVMYGQKTLAEYLAESGLYVSRTYFILQTTHDIDEHAFENIIGNPNMEVGVLNQPMPQNLQQVINPLQSFQQINVIPQHLDLQMQQHMLMESNQGDPQSANAQSPIEPQSENEFIDNEVTIIDSIRYEEYYIP